LYGFIKSGQIEGCLLAEKWFFRAFFDARIDVSSEAKL
jgi:hypothetical protein